MARMSVRVLRCLAAGALAAGAVILVAMWMLTGREEDAPKRPARPARPAEVDEAALKEALAAAAAMDPVLVKVISGPYVPDLASYPDQPLTFVLLASGYIRRPADMHALNLSYLAGQMLPKITKGGVVSVLHESLISRLEHRPLSGTPDRIEGTVGFTVPRDEWFGSYGFVAEWTGRDGGWRIVEFRLPQSRRRVVLQDDGKWRVVMGLERERQTLGAVALQFWHVPPDEGAPGLLARNDDPLGIPLATKYAEAPSVKERLAPDQYPGLIGRLPGTFCEKDFFRVQRYEIVGNSISASVQLVRYTAADRARLPHKTVYLTGNLPALLPGRYKARIEFTAHQYDGDKSKVRPADANARKPVRPMQCEFEVRAKR